MKGVYFVGLDIAKNVFKFSWQMKSQTVRQSKDESQSNDSVYLRTCLLVQLSWSFAATENTGFVRSRDIVGEIIFVKYKEVINQLMMKMLFHTGHGCKYHSEIDAFKLDICQLIFGGVDQLNNSLILLI